MPYSIDCINGSAVLVDSVHHEFSIFYPVCRITSIDRFPLRVHIFSRTTARLSVSLLKLGTWSGTEVIL